MPESIPSELEQRLRKALLRCGPFDSDRSLRAIFVDERIAAWREDIPDNTPNRDKRVAAFIESLFDQSDDAGNNALALTLRILADRTPLEDSCHHELAELADAVQSASTAPDETPVSAPGIQYNITIIDGKVGVIGNDAKVKGGIHFDNKPTPETISPRGAEVGGRIQCFERYYLNQSHFVGRQDVMAELNEWLMQTEISNAFLSAPAGLGKSALLVHWITQLREDGKVDIVYHPISLRFETHQRSYILNSLVRQLTKVYGESYSHTEDEQSLQDYLLDLLLKPPTVLKRSLLIVIDGLDEIEAEKIQLPGKLPNGLHILATGRIKTDEKVSDYKKWAHELKWDGSDFRPFRLGPLSRMEVEESTQMILGPSVAGLAQRLYELSEGDPLVLNLYLNHLRCDKHKNIQNILPADIKPGLEFYIEETEKTLQEDAAYDKDFFGLLVAAYGPLMLEDFQSLRLKSNLADLPRLIKHSRGLVIGDGENQGMTFSHPRIGYAYRTVHEKQFEAWHDRFLVYGRDTFARLCAGREKGRTPAYVLNYYFSHLLSAPQSSSPEEIFALLCKEWMQAHYDHSGSYDSFLNDVGRIWEKATEIGRTAISTGPTTKQDMARALAIQVKCALCFASVASLCDSLPPSLPALLVSDKLWSPTQAIAYVNRISDTAPRATGRLELLTTEECKRQLYSRDIDILCKNVLNDLQRIQDVENSEVRGRLLLRLLPHLGHQRTNTALASTPGLMDIALELARNLGNEGWRGRVLGNIISYLKNKALQVEVTEEVLGLSGKWPRKSTDDSSLDTLYCYQELARNLPMDVLAEARKGVWNDGSYQQQKALEQFFGDFSWHISNEQASDFVDILCDAKEAFPYVPLIGNISHFSANITDDTALAIAHKLQGFVVRVIEGQPVHARENFVGDYVLGLIALVQYRQDPTCKDDILAMWKVYRQTFKEQAHIFNFKFFLYDLYNFATGHSSDADIVALIEEQDRLSRDISLEEALCFGPLALQAFLQNWKRDSIDLLNFLPIAAQNIPDDALAFLYDRGKKLEWWQSQGYVRALARRIDRVPESLRADLLHWLFTDQLLTDPGNELALALAPYMTIERVIDLAFDNTGELRYKKRDIIITMAPRLPINVLRYLVKVEENTWNLNWVQYLPKNERKPILRKILETGQSICDKGQLEEALAALGKRLGLFHRRQLSPLIRAVKNEVYDARLRDEIGNKGSRCLWEQSLSRLRFGPYNALLALLPALKKHYWLVLHPSGVTEALRTYYQKRATWLKTLPGIHRLLSQPILWWPLLLLALLIEFLITLVFLMVIIIPGSLFCIIGGVLILLFAALVIISAPISLPILVISRKYEQITSQITPWKSLRQKVEHINAIQNADEREQAFRDITRSARAPLSGHTHLNYIPYAEHAREIWAGLNPDWIEDAINVLRKDHHQVRDSAGISWQSNDYMGAIMPAVAWLRPDLLPELEQFIKQSYPVLEAVQYANLALFLNGSEKLKALKKSVEAFKYVGGPEYNIPSILTGIAGYASGDLLKYLLQWLNDYPCLEPLEKIAPKIVHELELLTQAFNVARKVNAPAGKFLCALAQSEISGEWVGKSALFIAAHELEERKVYGEKIKSYSCLCKRWVQLPLQEAYKTWCNVTEEWKKHSQGHVLDQLSELTEVIAYLGGEEAIIQVGQVIDEARHWWEITWRPNRRQKRPHA